MLSDQTLVSTVYWKLPHVEESPKVTRLVLGEGGIYFYLTSRSKDEKMERAGIPQLAVVGFTLAKSTPTPTERRYPNVLYRNGLSYCQSGDCGSE